MYSRFSSMEKDSAQLHHLVKKSLQVPSHDPSGVEIPKWKREMMAKKAAEKAKKEAIQRKAKEEEDLRMAAMPVWKKQLIEKKMEDPKR